MTGPDGADVAGLRAAELVEADVAVARFDALAEPGRYTVAYDYASRDGAAQQGAHQFRFEPDRGDGFPLRAALVAAVGAVLVAVLVALAVRSVRRR